MTGAAFLAAFVIDQRAANHRDAERGELLRT